MSKETVKMNSIRINRIGIKALLLDAEIGACANRNAIRKYWDKEDDAERAWGEEADEDSIKHFKEHGLVTEL